MRNLFVGILHSEEEAAWLQKYSKSGIQVAANNYQWNFINGLEANLNKTIDIISTLSMGSYPKSSRRLLVKSKSIKTGTKSFLKYIGYFNFYLIKGFCRFVLLFFELRKWIKNNPKGNIYVYSLYSPYLWALFFTKGYRKKKYIKYCLIVTDLMGKYGILKPVYTVSGISQRIDSFFQYRLSQSADCYVFLTNKMAGPMNIGRKPYTVIEGLITIPKNLYLKDIVNKSQTNKKVVLYTGSLLKEFGIDILMEAFLLIPNKDYELWICGPENESKTVVEYSKFDKRIKYLGFINKQRIVEVQQSATILVNPRPNLGEYVKYSFPSKTMEYLLSAKPVVMFKLDGIPKEYYDFIFFIEKYDVDCIAQTLLSVCNKTDEELHKFGSAAQRFIVKYKNCKIQTKKAIELLEISSLN